MSSDVAQRISIPRGCRGIKDSQSNSLGTPYTHCPTLNKHQATLWFSSHRVSTGQQRHRPECPLEAESPHPFGNFLFDQKIPLRLFPSPLERLGHCFQPYRLLRHADPVTVPVLHSFPPTPCTDNRKPLLGCVEMPPSESYCEDSASVWRACTQYSTQ